MRYYRPYIDSSGEKFYLPKKWRQSLSGHGKSKAVKCWQESKINYSFDNEMNGTQLIRNLDWLGRTNYLLEMNVSDEEEEDSDNDVKKKPNLYGSGKPTTSNAMDKRELRQALPEMSATLENWTLHGQNLGSMLDNYRLQYRNMGKRQRRELGHFFNMASNVLDTISSMTENTILKSVKFGRDELVGGGAINNKPPIPLLPTEENLSRYIVIFPGYSIDKGNVLRVDTVGRNLFTSEYPKYPDSQSLAVNPNLPIEEKFYSTDASSMTDDDSEDNSDSNVSEDMDESYV